MVVKLILMSGDGETIVLFYIINQVFREGLYLCQSYSYSD